MSRQKKRCNKKRLRRKLQYKEMRAQKIRWKLLALHRIVEYAEDPEERAWAEALHRKLGDCLDRYEKEIADLYCELEGIG